MSGKTIQPVMLGQLKKERFNLCLGGPAHSGKSIGAASFFGGERGKVVWFAIEHGQPEGAGGATPLHYLAGINDRLDPDRDCMVLHVDSWEAMQASYKYVCDNAVRLVREGYVGMVWDGVTELCAMLEDAFQEIDARVVLGASYTDGQAKRDAKRFIVTDIDGLPGSSLEQADYGTIIGRVRNVVKGGKLLPFTFIMTALDGPIFDKDSGLQKGTGPEMTGRKLPDLFVSWVDYYFHCERAITKTAAVPAKGAVPAVPASQRIDYRWLTANDPAILGNQNRFFAKSRAGLRLAQYEPADGAALLDKLGISPATDAAKGVAEATAAVTARKSA